ncbi:MAG: TlpA disulfide reductase family protein [Bacteroidota bacterium]
MNNVKSSFILLIALLFGLQSFAQFNLSGKISHYTGKESLKVNIPMVYGFHRENSISIPITKDGHFSISLPISQAKFANLIYQRQFYTLLLHPAKNLVIELNEADTVLKLLGGTALPVNKLMQQVDLEEYPFFMANNYGTDKFSLQQLNEQVLQPYYAQRDSKIKKVMNTSIPENDKLLIASELKYIAYNYLNDLARGLLTNKPTIDSLIMVIFDQNDPKPEVFPAGPQYYGFAANYLRYLETKAFIEIKKNQIKPSEPIPYFGISLDSANVVVKKYGKPYWRLIGATRNLLPKVTEQLTYQEISNLFDDKDLRLVEALTNAFTSRFPNSPYNAAIRKKATTLRALLAKNEQNKAIEIVEGFEKINSIYDVIRPLKGKVVYVDVWGTWCGPCKEELYFLPGLKARFANKDVAYIYLDLDDDDMDLSWREFIKVNNLTGLHLRKTRQNIAPFWKELLANTDDKAEYYPQYFIFDKDGKLVVSKANRPSSKELLYAQIEEVLK